MNTTDSTELGPNPATLLVGAKQRSLGFAGSFSAKNRVLGKEVAWRSPTTTTPFGASPRTPSTTTSFPRKGAACGWTRSASPHGLHRKLAEKFINFMLDARLAAGNADFTRTATAGNEAALEFIPPSDRANPGIYPPPEIMARLEYAYDLGPTNRVFDELWTQIKTK